MPTGPTDDKNPEQAQLQTTLKERFDSLPPVIKTAITSADVQQHLRELANTHKLHLDQWQLLENEVMLTLLGIQSTDELQANIKSEVGVTDVIAAALAGDISKTVFEPIRGELERLLEHPDAQAAVLSDVEAARAAALQQDAASGAAATADAPANPVSPATAQPPVQPATPPAPAPDTKTARAPVSQNYTAGTPSNSRASVADDPYREPPA